MNFQNNRYTIRPIQKEDDEGIREIFEATEFDGSISVKYLRNPSPFDSFQADGDDTNLLVITDNQANKIITIGGGIIRYEYVHGEIKKCAYMTSMKVHPDYLKKVRFISNAFQLFYEQSKDCDYFYTTILKDNHMAISMFEKGHRNMPKYNYIGNYITYCFRGVNSTKKNPLLEKNKMDGFDDLVKNYFRKLSFTPVNTDLKGFGQKDFYCIRDKGEIIACCFVGNQQFTKQYQMCNYKGIYKLASLIPTQMMGYPRFPKSGSLLHFGVVSYLYVKDCDVKLCKKFIKMIARQVEYSILIWGGFEKNPLCHGMDAIRAVHYESRFYLVQWENTLETQELEDWNNESIGIEAALL